VRKCWIAIASEKTWNDQPRSPVIGARNRPCENREPFPIARIRKPAIRTTMGNRITCRLPEFETGEYPTCVSKLNYQFAACEAAALFWRTVPIREPRTP